MPNREPIAALGVDFPAPAAQLLSPLDGDLFIGRHFLDSDPSFYPLASDVLVQARQWILSEGAGLSSGYQTAASEPVQAAGPDPKRGSRPKRPTIAQLAQWQANLAELVARISDQLEELRQAPGRTEAAAAPAAQAGRQGRHSPPRPHDKHLFPRTACPSAQRPAAAAGKDPAACAQSGPASSAFRPKVFGACAGSAPSCPDLSFGKSGRGGSANRPGCPDGRGPYLWRVARRAAAGRLLGRNDASEQGSPGLGGADVSGGRPCPGPELLLHCVSPRLPDPTETASGAGTAYRELCGEGKRASHGSDGPRGGGLHRSFLLVQGGYAKSKEQGLIAWQVAIAFDLIMSGNTTGAADSLALLALYLDQMTLDGSPTVAWLLTLLQDPPQSLFSDSSAPPGINVQPFSHLADQKWITSALGFLKEMDLISSRRQEAKGRPRKPPGGPPSTDAPEETALSKKQLRAAQWAAKKAAQASGGGAGK